MITIIYAQSIPLNKSDFYNLRSYENEWSCIAGESYLSDTVTSVQLPKVENIKGKDFFIPYKLNKFHIIQIIILIFLFKINTLACDCVWGGSFMSSLNNSDIIFVGKVIGYDQYSPINKKDTSYFSPSVMIVEIEELISEKEGVFTVFNHIKTKRTVRVLGNIDSNCRPEVSSFSLNSRWLFKMNKARENNYFQIDLIVSNCATNYLEIIGNTVHGNIEGENQKTLKDAVSLELDINKIKEQILKKIETYH